MGLKIWTAFSYETGLVCEERLGIKSVDGFNKKT